jgi:hypothetical protein
MDDDLQKVRFEMNRCFAIDDGTTPKPQSNQISVVFCLVIRGKHVVVSDQIQVSSPCFHVLRLIWVCVVENSK